MTMQMRILCAAASLVLVVAAWSMHGSNAAREQALAVAATTSGATP